MCAKKKKMLYDIDKWLKPYKAVIDKRHKMILEAKEKFSTDGSLSKGMNNHIYYGMHKNAQGDWVFPSIIYVNISIRRMQVCSMRYTT